MPTVPFQLLIVDRALVVFGNSSSAFFAPPTLYYHFIFPHRDHYSISFFSGGRSERPLTITSASLCLFIFTTPCYISSAGKISCCWPVRLPRRSRRGKQPADQIFERPVAASCEFNICLVICTFDLELLAVDSTPGSRLAPFCDLIFVYCHFFYERQFETRFCSYNNVFDTNHISGVRIWTGAIRLPKSIWSASRRLLVNGLDPEGLNNNFTQCVLKLDAI